MRPPRRLAKSTSPTVLGRVPARARTALAAGAGAIAATWLGSQYQAEGLARIAPAVAGLGAGIALERWGLVPGLGYGVAAGGIAASLMGPVRARGQKPAPGVALTIWSGDGLERAWAAQRSAVAAVRPQILCLHYGGIGTDQGTGRIVREAREICGNDLRFWVEVYADDAVAQGPDQLVRFAGALARSMDAEAVVWDAERAFRSASGAQAAQRLLDASHASFEDQIVGHTAYSSPRVHAETYPWGAWLGGDGYRLRADFSLAQLYPFGDERREGMIPGGTMDLLARAAWGGWAGAKEDGAIAPDLRVGAYLPGAHVPADALVRAAANTSLVAVWPWHGVFDAEAMAAAGALRRRMGG